LKLFTEQVDPGGLTLKLFFVVDPEYKAKDPLGAEKPDQRLARQPFQEVWMNPHPCLVTKSGCQSNELFLPLPGTHPLSFALSLRLANGVQNCIGTLGKFNGMDGGGKIGAGASQEECDTSFHGRSSDTCSSGRYGSAS